MIDAPIDDDTVACAHLPALALGLKANMAANDINHLMMRMAVAGALPVFVKGVTHEHEVRVVCKDLADHARFGRGRCGGVRGCVDDSRIAHRFCLMGGRGVLGEP